MKDTQKINILDYNDIYTYIFDSIKLAKQNNCSAFYNALSRYAKQQTGKNAAAIECLQASLKNTQLNDEIAKLRTKLYSSADEQVDLSLIVSLLSQAAKQTKSTSNATELKNLYD